MRKLDVKAEKFNVYLRPDGNDYDALFEQIAGYYANKDTGERLYDKNGNPNRSLIVRLLVQDKAQEINNPKKRNKK